MGEDDPALPLQDARAETLDVPPCPVCARRNPPDALFCGGCGLALNDGAPRPDAVADPLIGRVIADRYRIVELLGRGGMGVVYKVEHIHIGKLMAMKLLHGELARDKNTIRRFQREAEAASRLSHPNTVQVFDFGRSEGLMYLVMEYLEGRDLGELVREEGHLDFERVARIGTQICASIAEAHANGVVHRDLKPENVMIIRTSDGREIAKVLDFGLAKLRDHAGSVSVTRAGAIVGTPYYMPPEQIRGETVDARGDIYAVGALLYKAATGVPPFVAKTPMGVLTKHLTEELVLPSRRSGFHLPGEADAIIGRAMEKDVARRHQNADELRAESGRLPRVGRPGDERPDDESALESSRRPGQGRGRHPSRRRPVPTASPPARALRLRGAPADGGRGRRGRLGHLAEVRGAGRDPHRRERAQRPSGARRSPPARGDPRGPARASPEHGGRGRGPLPHRQRQRRTPAPGAARHVAPEHRPGRGRGAPGAG